MSSRTRRTPVNPAQWVAMALVLTAAALPAAAVQPPPDQEQATRTVVVGKATLNWHVAQKASAPQRAELAAAFKKATEARFTGGEPYVTPKAEPSTSLGGQRMLPLPVELIHTMFVDADGQEFCSDSTAVTKAAATTSVGKDQ